jgi:RimJ/RimL family protein N-acetyltransferase
MASMWNLAPRLTGEIVTLEPLAPEHFDALAEAGRPAEIWTWWSVEMAGEAAFRRWFDDALRARGEGVRAHFATLEERTGRPIGSTSYLTLRPEHAGLEIGWTWLNPAAWRSGANAEAKLLMLGHAFEALGCQRVEFSTHERNERSRRALEALPAQFEGVRRDDRRVLDGRRRSSAVYSILDHEWPGVAAALTSRIAAARASRAVG